jgi:hypothetical protein
MGGSMGVLTFMGLAFRWSMLALLLLASAPIIIYCLNFWYKVFKIKAYLPDISDIMGYL